MNDRREKYNKLFLESAERTGAIQKVQQLLASDSVLTIRSNKTVWRVLQDDDDGDDLVLATEHRTPRKGKPNLIDQKTLYDNTRTHVASRVLEHPPASHVRLRCVNRRDSRRHESDYTDVFNSGDNQNIESFRNMIIRSFYRTPASPRPGNNGAKKPLIREGNLYYHLVESLKKQKQQRDQIDLQMALMKPITCEFNEGTDREYCDILGPVSCSRCIESTNRHIATEIQKGIFPDIEVTLNSLVVPNISNLMKSSDNILARKRRMSMLNNGFLFPRHETQLRQSDLRRPTTQSTKLPSFSSSEHFPNWTSSFMSSRNITSLTMESSILNS